MPFYTYIAASARNGTLYTGMTDELRTRIDQHRDGTFGGFTARYGAHHLVWFEEHETREQAFRRERQSKEWKRAWKLKLIESMNPEWRDLSDSLDPSPNEAPLPDEIRATPVRSPVLPRAKRKR